MQEVTLTIYDVETGEEERVGIDLRRFTIGRLPENDLSLDDSSLSRRHALIERADGSVIVSDCGSQNGTFVNGKPVVGAVELHDGDLLTFGGSTEITVEIRHESTQYAGGPSTPVHAPAENPTPAAGSVSPSIPSWMNAPVLAAAAVVLILLGAGLLVAINQTSSSAPRVPSTPAVPSQSATVEINPPVEPSIVAETPAQETPAQETRDEPNDKVDELVDRHARTVMSSISYDSSPFLPRDVVREVRQKVNEYHGSSFLRDELRAVKRHGFAQIADAGKDKQIKPALAIFTALAKMDRSKQQGDPISVAQDLMPALARLRAAFGTESANDSLLIVATIDQPFSGGFHPLLHTLATLSHARPESAKKIRTFWYLYKNQKISSEAYDLVLRFLAIGVIAQDPPHFGVDAEPLVF